MQVGVAGLVGAARLLDAGQDQTLALGVDAVAGHVIQPEHHVLRRHDDGLAVGRRQDVVRRHHQRAGLELRLDRQRHVHGHLVAVEIGVERGADQRMQLNSLALDQHRLERLNAKTMQGRRAVQHHRVLADDLLEDVPDLRRTALDHLLRGLDGRGQTAALQLAEDERLEQLQRHALGQATLVQHQRRPDHDDRAARVVDTLAEQVLAEAALLALDHVGQRLQRALVGAGDGATTATVVEQRVHRLLQHALLVAHDDVRRDEVEQPLQAVVSVDDAPIQIVEVRGREAATVQRHQRAQFRRQHRQHGQDHPFRTVARCLQRLDQLEPLGQLLDLGLGVGGLDVLAHLTDLGVEVDGAQQFEHRLGAHARIELVAVRLERLQVLIVGQQLPALEVGHAGIDDDEGLEIEHALDVAQRHIEQQANTRWQRLQEPDVRDRAGQIDMTHALAAHLGQRDLDAALLAHDAAMLQALVLAAQALVVADRAEDLGAEQAVALGFEGTVVDGLRLLDLAVGPGADHLRRRQADADGVELQDLTLLLDNSQ